MLESLAFLCKNVSILPRARHVPHRPPAILLFTLKKTSFSPRKSAALQAACQITSIQQCLLLRARGARPLQGHGGRGRRHEKKCFSLHSGGVRAETDELPARRSGVGSASVRRRVAPLARPPKENQHFGRMGGMAWRARIVMAATSASLSQCSRSPRRRHHSAALRAACASMSSRSLRRTPLGVFDR